jgi:hypothetical protein
LLKKSNGSWSLGVAPTLQTPVNIPPVSVPAFELNDFESIFGENPETITTEDPPSSAVTTNTLPLNSQTETTSDFTREANFITETRVNLGPEDESMDAPKTLSPERLTSFDQLCRSKSSSDETLDSEFVLTGEILTFRDQMMPRVPDLPLETKPIRFTHINTDTIVSDEELTASPSEAEESLVDHDSAHFSISDRTDPVLNGIIYETDDWQSHSPNQENYPGTKSPQEPPKTGSSPTNDISQSLSRCNAPGTGIKSFDAIDLELLDDFKRMLVVMGIPWIAAPGEAEAQCAWLESNGHVDGVISDDNDCFLFGTQRLIRHCFGGRSKSRMGVKPTLYEMRLIRETIGLSKDRFLCLAVLLGSDYSIGVKGIGPKKALHLLNEMGPVDEDDLVETIFEGLRTGKWPSKVDSARVERLLRPRPLIENSFGSDSIEGVKRIKLAYLSPVVDDSCPIFSWESMLKDIPAIVSYARSDRMRWTDSDCRMALDPLIRRGL